MRELSRTILAVVEGWMRRWCGKGLGGYPRRPARASPGGGKNGRESRETRYADIPPFLMALNLPKRDTRSTVAVENAVEELMGTRRGVLGCCVVAGRRGLQPGPELAD